MCSRCKQVQEETHTHSCSSSNMDNSSRSQNVFPTMTPKIPGIPARCVKIPQCCHRSTQSGRSGHHPDQRSAPDVHRVEVTACLQREKKSKDCADAHWHLLSMTAALTDVIDKGRNNCTTSRAVLKLRLSLQWQMDTSCADSQVRPQIMSLMRGGGAHFKTFTNVSFGSTT